MDDLLGLLENSLALNKTAATAQAEVADLRAKLAAAPKVVLQKVATEAVLDNGLLDETLQTLVDTAYLTPGNREKLAAELRGNPNAVLRLAGRIATLSIPGHTSGAGVKSASATTTPTAAGEWDKVVAEGA